ncbi:hypothetical protein COLO4_09299 [Corchorus olitorius]|uniref:Uncharacterized protein n=1 Tax=Corchorus olitorius TaxID=93759 RepID=A0A1R3KCH9_9ROSI|nr:hypothetical protein COLO4_09299 [Corchorus olitorius]
MVTTRSSSRRAEIKSTEQVMNNEHLLQEILFYPKYEDIANTLGVDPTKSAIVMEFNQVATINLAFDLILKHSFHQVVNLAFDPLKSPHYKFLSIWSQLYVGKDPKSTICYKFPKYTIDVFSSETNSWSFRKVDFSFKANEIRFSRVVFLNGKSHWGSTDDESVYYDVDSELARKMPFPKGDYSNWFLIYTLELDAMKYTFVHWSKLYLFTSYLMCCVIQSDEKIGDFLLIVLPGGKAISYDLVDRTVKKFAMFQY